MTFGLSALRSHLLGELLDLDIALGFSTTREHSGAQMLACMVSLDMWLAAEVDERRVAEKAYDHVVGAIYEAL